MQILIPKEKRNETFTFSGTVTSLLDRLNINKETVLVSVNDELVGDDHTIDDTDVVTLHSVISGG